MSFIDKISGFAKGLFKKDTIGSTLARTALLGLALNKMNKSIQKANEAANQRQPERIQLNPNTENPIPVVYGNAYVKGAVTDAYLSNDKLTMWFCLTICEVTGNLLSTSSPSVISFNEAYMDGLRLSFKSDGYTVDKIYDESGNSSDKWSGLIEIYPFNNGSANPTSFTTQSTGNTTAATSLFPDWTATDAMSNLVFVLVKIKYNADKDLRRLGEMQFKISNTMKKPGDCLFDYATNTRYGAGIPAAEINQ